MNPERLLVVLLRLAGAFMLLAFAAMVMPTDWMVTTHAWLGMGELPRIGIVDYLTRSLSALSGVHGVLLIALSTNPVQYKGVVRWLGVTNIGFGAALVGIDLHAGMPPMWTAVEGPSVAVFGIILLYLVSRLR